MLEINLFSLDLLFFVFSCWKERRWYSSKYGGTL